MKFMLKPVVMYPFISVTVTEQQEEGIILALQGLEKSHEERATPSQVYSKLLMVLKTLHKHLLGTVLMEELPEMSISYWEAVVFSSEMT